MLIFNYQGERLKENVEELAATFGADTPVAPCDWKLFPLWRLGGNCNPFLIYISRIVRKLCTTRTLYPEIFRGI